MTDYTCIKKPDLGYCYEFATDELIAMSECLEAHGFAIIKDVLQDEIVEKLKQAVYDGTDPDGTLEGRAESHATCLDRVWARGMGAFGIRAIYGYSSAFDRYG